MQNNFNKFKKRARLNKLIKCIIAGCSCAAFAVGAILLVCKLKELNPLYSLLGLFGFIVGVLPVLLCVRTNDKSLSKQLDDTLDLEEKTQTMIEYAGDDSAIANLQRESAENALAANPENSIKFSRLWLYIMAGVISVSMLGTSLVYGYDNGDVNGGDGDSSSSSEIVYPPHEVTEWEWQALDELIIYVQKSNATKDTKDSIVDALERLVSRLKGGVAENRLQGVVDGTRMEIFNIQTEVQKSGKDSDEVATDVEICQYVYDELYNIFGFEAPASDEKAIEKWLRQLTELITEVRTNEEATTQMSSGSAAALQQLYDSLESKKDEETIDEKAVSKEVTDTMNKVDQVLNTANNAAGITTSEIKNNIDLREYIRTQLADIFNIMLGEPSENEDSDGVINIGAADRIFDKDQGYVKYMDVIGQNRTDVLDEIMNGAILDDSVDWYEIYELYFNYLYGNKTEDDNGNGSNAENSGSEQAEN